ncbi:tail fiber protein [Acidovorax sp. SUPP2522]|uniref:phage tail protein n=1 Tax=unclassified Acidovorax TaxID=2684926 RepID=UPI002349726F|nr:MULTISPECIES: tail fiber protein [unclassified Acidovorax]WCM98511.1 tail fiber protein [Acidovorax sp. GBBC 1281]GKT13964.1 tail fiber protein [Acidovorax sp. SUPP2522]
MDPILGQIILWAVPWVPQGWALCDGTLLSINQNQALYSLLGTRYGGDGVNTFGLPDLRNRVPLGSQNMVTIGGTSGAATASTNAIGAAILSLANLPAHTHGVTVAAGGTASVSIPADDTTGDNNVPGPTLIAGKATAGNNTAKVYSSKSSTTTLKPFDAPLTLPAITTQAAGSVTPTPVQMNVPVTVSTLQPGITLNFIIAVNGIYPSRP